MVRFGRPTVAHFRAPLALRCGWYRRRRTSPDTQTKFIQRYVHSGTLTFDPRGDLLDTEVSNPVMLQPRTQQFRPPPGPVYSMAIT